MLSREASNVITIRHLNAQSQQQNHWEKVLYMSRGKNLEKNVWGGIHVGKFSERRLFQEEN